MGLKYVWDTNTVIYYLQNHFSASQKKQMDDIINNYQPSISVMTEIELLCWKNATENDLALLNSFISECTVFGLDEDIKLKTIEIRKNSSLKLPDSIIAATALTNNLVLISRNSADFRKVASLEFIDPFNLV